MDFERADALNAAIRTIAIKHRARAAGKLAQLGLHPGQEAVMLLLDAHGPQTQRQLAAGASCEPPSITLMVRKLEAAALISRTTDPRDSRATLVRLTSEGQKVTRRLKELWRDLADETAAGLTDPEIDHLLTILLDLGRRLQVKNSSTDQTVPSGTYTNRQRKGAESDITR